MGSFNPTVHALTLPVQKYLIPNSSAFKIRNIESNEIERGNLRTLKRNHHCSLSFQALRPPTTVSVNSPPFLKQLVDSMNEMEKTRILPNQNYVVWSQPPFPPLPENLVMLQSAQRPQYSVSSNSIRSNWMGKRSDTRQKDSLGKAYNSLNSNDLHYHYRSKSRRFYPKKKLNYRFPPFAPRNTTSYIIRAKKAGGIASLVSPCPVTPAVLPTPIFSPSSEVLVDMAKEQWGVDGYGSMKGLIRLRSPKDNDDEEDDEEEGGGSSDSDVEEHLEVERRLDHDLSRFEMIYPSCRGEEQSTLLESRVDDQDTHIAHLGEENLTLKERVFLMERDMADLRRRIHRLETHSNHFQMINDNRNEETAASENVYGNDCSVDVCSAKSG